MNVERFAYFGVVENEKIEGLSATKAVRLSGKVAIQVSEVGSPHDAGFILERATIDPNSGETPNWVAVKSFGVSFERTAILFVEEPAVAWWRVRACRLDDASSAHVSISGGGA